MAIGSLIATSRSSRALAAAAISQASRVHQHTTISPLLSRLGPVARAFSSSPGAADADLGVSVMEGQVKTSSVPRKGLAVEAVRMKMRVVCRKLYDYVRYDLKEIAFPSSLPDPPGTVRRPKLTLKEKWCILKEATRLYGASWVRDIGPELRPNDYKKAKEESGPTSTEKGKSTSEPTVLEDLAVAARGGAETLKPALRRIYMTRASTYTSTVKNYVETYQEGLKDVLDEKAAGKDSLFAQTRRVGNKAKGAKSGKAMMFPLHFHYEDVLREDLLLKLNHTNVMEVPGLFEIRLVPKSTSDAKIQFGKLAMEILCGQRSIQAQLPAHLKSGRSSSNSFLASQKDATSLRQSIIQGHGMYNFLVRVLTVMSMLDSKVSIEQGNCIKFFMATEFCEFSPEIEDHFEIFENIGGFNVTIVTSASSKEETSLLWSGFLLKDEGEIN
ncbi:hypothetical protein ACQ4PT_056982 [Festuca glaucescens]